MGVEKCQGCAYLNPIMFHCGKYLRGIETAMYLCHTAKPQTNADRIRAMTDKELAKWLDDISKACYYEGYTKETDEPQMSPYPTSPAKWVTWMKQEASE